MKKQDDPLAHDIASRLQKERTKPSKKKPESKISLQLVLAVLMAVGVIMGMAVSLLAVLK